MWNYIYLIFTNLKWACNCLLYRAFCKEPNYNAQQLEVPWPEIGDRHHRQELNIEQYEHQPGRGDCTQVQCAVCLCTMEDGDEIRVLRCQHIFHRVCLDRWVGHMNHINPTCPICRDSLAPARIINELQAGVEVLYFNFYSNRSDNRERWWLR
ncbi:hypothetical protein I3760_05G118700 [Carya illinoinensis]|nr:hypothetical protein I3760_05G118700 [Carya illinoinensis]